VSGATQLNAVDPWQTPAAQTSPCVHALLSSHALPSGFTAGLEQVPVTRSRVPGA
jgi:hypothetical protein